MGDKVYTRKGTVFAGGGTEDYKPIRTYRVPIESGDEIRINIPENATRSNIRQAAEHLQVICRFWGGVTDEEYTDRPE